jgi:MFS family permease
MPRAAGYGFHASVTQAGLFLLPSTVMMLIVSPLAGRLANRVGSRVPLVSGCVATCAAFVFLAVAHGDPWEFYVGSAILGVGIGLAFASLANLIVEAVPPDQTGVATGMNTVMRSLGGSVGSQIGASIIAGTVVGHALPTEHGFTVAFVLAAAACGLAALASLAVPRPGASGVQRARALVADTA